MLISRTKETPVQLVAAPQGYWLYTEAEAQKGTTPAFELRPKLGFYCRGHQVVGFSLQPLTIQAAAHAEATQLAK
ncbi:MAG: hypothetical protein DCF32_22030 [Leptolyngbya sp.]|nr:MAG: hypothetical protein DCF32_22030 [Leptolyngbya sp.]